MGFVAVEIRRLEKKNHLPLKPDILSRVIADVVQRMEDGMTRCCRR